MIRKAGISDAGTIADLAVMLWSGHSAGDLIQEFSEVIEKDGTQFFLLYDQDTPVGFAQCQLRHDYVEGTQTSPVGYLEGIFVRAESRNQGYGRELAAECEKWARENGCKEFASDCEMNNDTGFQFHKALGFTEANRIICFAKKL